MNIVEVTATNLTIPYETPYRPAWQPGIVRNSRDFTLVRIETDDGIVGYGGSDGHQAGNVRSNVAPYMVGKPAWLTEEHARVFRNAGGTWFIDVAVPDERITSERGAAWRLASSVAASSSTTSNGTSAMVSK